jgi:hypothetical protein
MSLLGASIAVKVSLWAAGAVFALTIAGAVYKAGKEEWRERKKLAERLQPKVVISGIGPTTQNHRRIMVRNLTGRRVRFRARLCQTEPQLKDYPLPVDLQPTHCQSSDNVGELGPYEEEPVDIFIDDGIPHPIRLKLMGNPSFLYPISRDKRIELHFFVYPVSEDGEGAYRWFYVVPQPDGSVIFSPDGETETTITTVSVSAHN